MNFLLHFLACSCVISNLVKAASVCEDVYPHISMGLKYNSQQECESVGGCWNTVDSNSFNTCYFPKVYGYHFTESRNQKGLISGNLTLIKPSGALGPDYSYLNIAVMQEKENRIRIKISPITGNGELIPTWEVPESIVPRGGSGSIYSGRSDLSFKITNDPFELIVLRGKVPIFFMSKMLIFQEQYFQVVLASASDVAATYGFGESTRTSQQLQFDSPYTLWNTDYWAANAGATASLYGTHPFLLQLQTDGTAHGAMLMNSNAMEMTMSQSSDKGNAIAIQSSGGLIDLYVFSGPSPLEVVKQYQELIGTPYLVPYWSLGFHNCRWGYPNLEYVEQVVANYSAAGIPLETQWVDIDYMSAYKDFTTDEVNFPSKEFKQFVDKLHSNGQRFVPIVDPGIYAVPALGDNSVPLYPALTEGLAQDVFIKDLTGDKPFLGQVWPGPTYYPDWFAANASQYWEDQLRAFHKLIPFDGIWIDMNEVSNFCNDGTAQVCYYTPEVYSSDGCLVTCETVDKTNKYDFPPYTPHVSQGSLSTKTVPMSALHANGILEYNAHSLYGLMESIATNQAISNIFSSTVRKDSTVGERGFVLSRSTFISSGKHTAHWTGDNAASWADLSDSIITINNLALFGISTTGADICGFAQDTTEELCARWIEVGAFYPFSRDHTEYDSIPQELYRWDSVAQAGRTALNLRYRLLPYLYTLLYMAHHTGDTVSNPLWMHFPADSQAITRDSQFMWSNGILFTPVLTEGATSVTGYFPAGRWYPLFDSDTYGTIECTGTSGSYITLPTPLVSTNAHVRGGTILPMQEAAMTTTAARRTPFTILIALDLEYSASGRLFLDDGVQRDIDNYLLIDYTFAGTSLTSEVVEKAETNAKVKIGHNIIGSIQVLGSTKPIKETCVLTFNSIDVTAKVTSAYEEKRNIISIDISALNVAVGSNFELSWEC